MQQISASQFQNLHDPLVIDVRTPAEYQEVCYPASVNIPLGDIEAGRGEFSPNDQQPVVLLCGTGMRASKAAACLQARHELEGKAREISVIEGGIEALANAGMNLQRGAVTGWSMERQVRFTAGLLVVLGIALGLLVNSAFLALPAFVGAGLCFAAVTNTCGMAMVLARMPWNTAGSRS